MGGVPHVEGVLNTELYTIPVKRRQPKEQKSAPNVQKSNSTEKQLEVDSIDLEDKDENLPPGWEKHEGTTNHKKKTNPNDNIHNWIQPSS